jgi:hypothetical protein
MFFYFLVMFCLINLSTGAAYLSLPILVQQNNDDSISNADFFSTTN